MVNTKHKALFHKAQGMSALNSFVRINQPCQKMSGRPAWSSLCPQNCPFWCLHWPAFVTNYCLIKHAGQLPRSGLASHWYRALHETSALLPPKVTDRHVQLGKWERVLICFLWPCAQITSRPCSLGATSVWMMVEITYKVVQFPLSSFTIQVFQMVVSVERVLFFWAFLFAYLWPIILSTPHKENTRILMPSWSLL